MTANPFAALLDGAVARGWCHPANSHKQMDPDLAQAITSEVLAALAAERAKTAKLVEACLPLQNLHMWTESAEDTEMVIVSVGTIRAIRAAITEASQ